METGIWRGGGKTLGGGRLRGVWGSMGEALEKMHQTSEHGSDHKRMRARGNGAGLTGERSGASAERQDRWAWTPRGSGTPNSEVSSQERYVWPIIFRGWIRIPTERRGSKQTSLVPRASDVGGTGTDLWGRYGKRPWGFEAKKKEKKRGETELGKRRKIGARCGENHLQNQKGT